MQALAERVGCAHASSAMVRLPNLMMLEETGLIAASTDLAGRKVYALVNEGLAALAKTGLLVDAILADAAGIDVDLGGAGPGMGARPPRARGAPALVPARRRRCTSCAISIAKERDMTATTLGAAPGHPGNPKPHGATF